MPWAIVAKALGGLLSGALKLARGIYDALPKVALLVIAGVLACFLMGSLGEASRQRHRADAVTIDRDDWKRATGLWRAVAGDWERGFHRAEKLRRDESGTAAAAQSISAAACAARVAEARRSSIAINDILHQEIPRDPNGCPARQLIDPDRLRGALQPRPARASRPR